jgi:hypothetical protein
MHVILVVIVLILVLLLLILLIFWIKIIGVYSQPLVGTLTISVRWLKIGWMTKRILLKLLTLYSFYRLRLELLILTIVTKIVLHILVLVLFLERFYRCRKVDFGFKKLV